MDNKAIEEIVRKVVAEYLGSCSGVTKHVDPSGVAVAKFSTVKLDKFATGNDRDQVYLKDVFTLKESPRIGCGVMEMTASVFDWTLKYDEIDYVVEGTLEIIIDGRKVVGNAGDILLIPKNTAIQFSAPQYAKFLYVVYPANWAEL